MGVFVWTLENVGAHDLEVTLMFTLQNGDGSNEDSAGGFYNEEFVCKGVYSAIQLRNIEEMTSQEDKEGLLNDDEMMSQKENNEDLKINDEMTSRLEEENGRTEIDNFSSDSSKNCSSTMKNNGDNDELNNNNNNSSRLSPQEHCIVHDVRGVLLHHPGLKQKYTLAIGAQQIKEVKIVFLLIILCENF